MVRTTAARSWALPTKRIPWRALNLVRYSRATSSLRCRRPKVISSPFLFRAGRLPFSRGQADAPEHPGEAPVGAEAVEQRVDLAPGQLVGTLLTCLPQPG